MTHMEIKVPKVFINDHDSRDLLRADDGTEYGAVLTVRDVLVRELKNHYIVRLTEAQAKELHSDADYYYTELGVRELGMEYAGLVASAKATRNAIAKVMQARKQTA